jgi:hypothetical protein
MFHFILAVITAAARFSKIHRYMLSDPEITFNVLSDLYNCA